MPTKAELQEQLDKMKGQLKINEQLMMDAAARAEELIGIREELAAMRKELQRLGKLNNSLRRGLKQRRR